MQTYTVGTVHLGIYRGSQRGKAKKTVASLALVNAPRPERRALWECGTR